MSKEKLGERALVAQDVMFIVAEWPKGFMEAVELHRRVTAPSLHNRQEILADIVLLQAVGSTDALRQATLSKEALADLDRLVALASSAHAHCGMGADLAEAIEENTGNRRYRCRTTERRGCPIDLDTFKLDLKVYEEMLADDADESLDEKMAAMKAGLAHRDVVLGPLIDTFAAAGFFGPDETVFVHAVDDKDDGHGFIRMPWVVKVGVTHAIAEIRAGTWY